MARPTTLPAPWNLLAERLGGVQALADALHSDTRTVNRWAHGERIPRGPALKLIRMEFAKAKLPLPLG